MTIEAVVFDVGKVLYRWELADFLATLEADPVRRRELIDTVVTVEWHGQADAGAVLEDMIAARIAAFPHHEASLRAYATRFAESIPGPVPGTHELVERLAARGVPLYAITNFGAEFWADFRPGAPIFDLFDDIVVSGVERLAKPDPAIFAHAAARFGLPPAHMLFVDDIAANVAAARRGGWQTHHFTDAVALERDLSARALI